MEIVISEIQILPIKPKDGLVGFASFIINNSIYLGSIGIHQKLDGSGYRLTYPTKNVLNKAFNLFYPITPTCSHLIENAVISKYREVMNKHHDRYNRINIE